MVRVLNWFGKQRTMSGTTKEGFTALGKKEEEMEGYDNNIPNIIPQSRVINEEQCLFQPKQTP